MKHIFIFILLGLFIVTNSNAQHSYYNTAMHYGDILSLDSDVADYQARVAAAGGGLSNLELRAYNKFVINAENFGIWTYIKDMCFFSGGYQGMLVKLKTHPNVIATSQSMDASAGTAMAAGNYGNNGGYIFLSGNVVKTRLTLADIPYNDFAFTHVRPNNSTGRNTGAVIFGTGNAVSSPINSIGLSGDARPTITPVIDGTQLGVDFDRVGSPWIIGNFAGVHTVNNFPVSGTRYTKSIFQNISQVGGRDEDNGSASFTGSNELLISTTGEQYVGTYSMSGYVISSGLPANLVETYQNLILTLHQDLGRNDLTFVRDIGRILMIGDSYTVGVGASGLGARYGYQVAYNYNPSLTFVGVDGVSGETITGFTTKFDAGKFGYINGNHLSSSTLNNYVGVELGTNDCGFLAGGSHATIKATLDALMIRLKTAGWRPIYITPIQSVNTSDAGYTSNFNSNCPPLISLVAADVRYTNGTYAYGVLRLDQISQLQNPLNTTYFGDGLHPTDAGYKIIANYLSVLYNSIANAGTTTSTSNLTNYTVSDGFFGIDATSLNGKVTEIGSKTWTIQNGLFDIYENKLRTLSPTSGAAIANVATIDMGATNGSVQVVVNSTFNSFASLIFRFVDINNYMLISFGTGTSPGFSIYKKIAGTFTQIGSSVGMTASTTGIYTMYADYTGNNFTCKVDAYSVSFSDANATSTGTKVGFSMTTGTGYPNTHTIDNFSAK